MGEQWTVADPFLTSLPPNTVVKVKGGRVGTLCHNNLDGYGIVWGEQVLDLDDLPQPDAMLRGAYPSADCECVGEQVVILRRGAFQGVRP